MKALCIQHVPFEGPAYIRNILEALKISLPLCRLYAGEETPDPAEIGLLLIMGGPMGANDEARYPWLRNEKRFIERAIKGGTIVIGICLGAQLIADVLGAPVTKNRHREIGWFPVRRAESATGLDGAGKVLPGSFYAFHWHGDTFAIPAGASRLAESDACANQAFLYGESVLALQFHLESTPESVRLLLDHARDELDGTKFVQGEREILETGRIDESNRLMERMIQAMLFPVRTQK